MDFYFYIVGFQLNKYWWIYVIREDLINTFDKLFLDFSEKQVDLFVSFLDNVDLIGRPLGFTNAKREDLIVNHLLDSLSAVDYIRKIDISSLCDVGSGVGFPGIILAIALPKVRVVLVERMKKRSEFLQMIKMKLNIDNVEIVANDIKNLSQYFDLITFRALTTMKCSLAKILLTKASVLMAYKGRYETVVHEAQMLEHCGYSVEIHQLNNWLSAINRTESRHLLTIKNRN